MSVHAASVEWQNREARQVNGRAEDVRRGGDHDVDSRVHTWRLGAAPEVRATAPPPLGTRPDLPNPEEALVCAIASSHMLAFLELCEKRNIIVLGYEDHAEGRLERGEDGRITVTFVRLRPEVMFGGQSTPSYEDLVRLHALAEDESPIGRAVRCKVIVEAAFFPPPV